MIVKVIYSSDGGFGHSFQGAVRYVAFDPEQQPTQERVDFVAVRNLPNKDPEVCWRLMASHCARRKELMREAGFKPRSSGKGEVAHIVLSWTDEERDDLTKEEMLRAADGALRHLNLEKNQCFMAAHNDTEENPHIHLIASRVDLETGKLVSSWRSHKSLSRWALAYERSRGGVVITQREQNWMARDNGIIPPKAKKSTSKDQYELEKAEKRIYEARRRTLLVSRVTVDPRRKAELRATGRLLRAHHLAAKRAVADRITLAKRHAMQRERHSEQTDLLHQHHSHRIHQIKDQAGDWKRLTKRRIEKAIAKRHSRLDLKHKAELGEFYQREGTRIGRIYNRLAFTDWKEVFARKQRTGEKGPSILSKAFTALSDVAHRRGTLLARQQAEIKQLYDNACVMRNRREKRIDATESRRLRAARVRYGRSLRLFDRLHSESQKRLKTDWKAFNAVRREVSQSAREAYERTKDLKKRVPSPVEEARRQFKRKKQGETGEGRAEGKSEAVAPKNKRIRRVRKPRKPRGPRRK